MQSLVRSGGRFAPAQVDALLALAAADGLRVARMDALWAYIEPGPPTAAGHRYDWRNTDAVAEQMARAGLRWDVILHGSPAWASTVPTSLFAAPTRERYGDFGAYAAAFVARYGQGGSFWAAHPELPYLPVVTVELWNEPNTEVHWGSAPDPAAYAALFAQARDAIKAVQPATQVLVGGIVWNDDANYLRSVLAALGPGASIDGVASHPYAPTTFSILPNVVRMRGALDQAGYPQVPLVLNELGWPAAYDRAPTSHAVTGPVSDSARAATMALTVDVLSRSTCAIGGLAIYDLVEAEDEPQFVESLMGIYRRDGSRTQTSAALADAVARFRAEQGRLGPPLPVCGARGAPATQLLPLAMTAVQNPRTSCTTVKVTYRGLPIEEARVLVLAPYTGRRYTAADGGVTACAPQPVGRRPVRLVAEIPGAARSNLVECVWGRCRIIAPAAACAVANTVRFGTKKPALVAARGVALRARTCDPQEGSTARLRAALVATTTTATALGLRRRTLGRASVPVGRGQVRTLRIRIARRADRRALRRAKKAGVEIRMTATEAGTYDARTRRVVLR